MSRLAFEVVDAYAERYAASPAIRLRVAVRDDGEPIDAIALRVRAQVEPAFRTYSAEEEVQLQEIFGARERWAASVRPLQWIDTGVTTGAFERETVFEVPLPCSYDMQVAAAKYSSALHGGDIPLRLLFTGTVFRAGSNGFSVEMLPWNLECTARLPVALWNEAMNASFPDHAWIRIDRTTFRALRRYRAERAFYSWEDAFSHLLAERAGDAP